MSCAFCRRSSSRERHRCGALATGAPPRRTAELGAADDRILTRPRLSISPSSGEELRRILNLAKSLKARRVKGIAPTELPLAGKYLGMVFDKPSTRTRVSFDIAMRELGGETIMLTGAEMQLGRGASPTRRALRVSAPPVRILSSRSLTTARWATAGHQWPAKVASLPGDGGRAAFEEHLGPIEGRTVAWSGDANNVLTSWVHAAASLGFTINVATPANFAPSEELVSWAKANGAKMNLTRDAYEAVAGADAVITDCWVSMGDADEDQRRAALAPYQVDSKLMRAAAKHAVFMHCLPAHRGEEVTEDVIDGPQSVVFDEAENRLHAQKGVLCWCLAPGQF
jgi:ornithine carbamoyltransferase